MQTPDAKVPVELFGMLGQLALPSLVSAGQYAAKEYKRTRRRTVVSELRSDGSLDARDVQEHGFRTAVVFQEPLSWHWSCGRPNSPAAHVPTALVPARVLGNDA